MNTWACWGLTMNEPVGIIFSVEPLTSAWVEISGLSKSHDAEVGMERAGVGLVLDIDIEKYLEMERTGTLVVFTMRKGLELVGYCAMIVTMHPHYRSSKTAFQDALYVDPAERGYAAVRFMEWTDRQLKEIGVELVTRSVTVMNNYSKLLLRFGYDEIETSYMRRL